MLGVLLRVFCFVHVKPAKQVLRMSLEIISPFRSFAPPISSGEYKKQKNASISYRKQTNLTNLEIIIIIYEIDTGAHAPPIVRRSAISVYYYVSST